MQLKSIISAFALSAIIGGIAVTAPAEAKNNHNKALNEMAVQMWLQQKAQQGIYFPDQYSAGQALQMEQSGIRIGTPYGPYGQYGGYGYNNYNNYGWGTGSYYYPF